jgi:hypothetical protein
MFMKTRATIAGLGGVMLLTTAGGASALASQSAAATSAAAVTRAGPAAAAPQYVVINCMNKAQVRPGTIVLACADDGMGLTHLHWTSWTPELASAYGTEWQNDCKPNCAEGHFHYYPVLVMLWGTATVKGHPGERRYTEATLSYPRGRPVLYVVGCNGKVVATYPVSQTLPLAL